MANQRGVEAAAGFLLARVHNLCCTYAICPLLLWQVTTCSWNTRVEWYTNIAHIRTIKPPRSESCHTKASDLHPTRRNTGTCRLQSSHAGGIKAPQLLRIGRQRTSSLVISGRRNADPQTWYILCYVETAISMGLDSRKFPHYRLH